MRPRERRLARRNGIADAIPACDHDTANEHCCSGMCCPDTCLCGPEYCENAR